MYSDIDDNDDDDDDCDGETTCGSLHGASDWMYDNDDDAAT